MVLQQNSSSWSGNGDGNGNVTGHGHSHGHGHGNVHGTSMAMLTAMAIIQLSFGLVSLFSLSQFLSFNSSTWPFSSSWSGNGNKAVFPQWLIVYNTGLKQCWGKRSNTYHFYLKSFRDCASLWFLTLCCNLVLKTFLYFRWKTCIIVWWQSISYSLREKHGQKVKVSPIPKTELCL